MRAIYYDTGKPWHLKSGDPEDSDTCIARERQEEEFLLRAAGAMIFRPGELNAYCQNEVISRLQIYQYTANNPMDWWFKHIDPIFLHRKIEETNTQKLLDGSEIDLKKLAHLADEDGFVFLKTFNKNCSGLVNINDPYAAQNNISATLLGHNFQNYIASEPISIELLDEGRQIKEEYRFWCVDYEPICGSTYGDYHDTAEEACTEHFKFCKKVLTSLKAQDLVGMPRIIVLDIAKTTDNNLVVIEANPYECSGRYYYNNFAEVISRFYGLDKKLTARLEMLERSLLDVRDDWKAVVDKVSSNDLDKFEVGKTTSLKDEIISRLRIKPK